MAFTGSNELLRKCSHCHTPRFYGVTTDGNDTFTNPQQFSTLEPQATYRYMPIIPRLKLLYANKGYAEEMRYPSTLFDDPSEDGIADIWEGTVMKDMREKSRYINANLQMLISRFLSR
jgi:hypothetical protein